MIYKQQAAQITNKVVNLIHGVIEAREADTVDSNKEVMDNVAELIAALVGSEPTITPLASCTCNAADVPAADITREIRPTSSTYWQTKDNCQIEAGITITLYRVLPKEGNTLTVTGVVGSDGWLTTNSNLIGPRYDVTQLYVTRYAAWNAHEEYRANGGTWSVFGNAERVGTESLTFNTKDMQAVKVGSIQTLWMVFDMTGEITRFTGRIDMKGNLFEIVGAEGEEIVPTFPINELYFWRVNLLKDELAAQSTSTAVEVEYSDNAEMDEWEPSQAPEYD